VIERNVLTIPSTDKAFRTQVERLIGRVRPATPAELEARLRRLFPRAVVRRREISGEPPAWYVYRDGGWRSDLTGPWWEAPATPRIVVSREGWIVDAGPTALGLLGMDAADLGNRHFTDFAPPGTLEDSMSMFAIVDEGHELTATVVLRSTTGDDLAIDVHSRRDGDRIVVLLRLADDVDLPQFEVAARASSLAYVPATDAAFRGYAALALARMPEPTVDGLVLRLHRLYPHARIEVDGDQWTIHRDAVDAPAEAAAWWTDPALPRVRYDAQALILEANEAAEALLGRSLVGHHWQEFVTPGSTEQVSAMLEILAEVGSAESRFRMPRADGTLLEFDSWTQVDDEGYTSVMRATASPDQSAKKAPKRRSALGSSGAGGPSSALPATFSPRPGMP
jgi:PAS domain-containing protein